MYLKQSKFLNRDGKCYSSVKSDLEELAISLNNDSTVNASIHMKYKF